ncbi:hypothetical protein OIV83_005884 [Microbotryomycetes sp. JL201]|nr:hypothetical protein OIV83_005884 [Microbotryomycetes sp. JL201]
MSYASSDKRRRLDDGYGSAGLYVAPSTSRTAAKARNDRAAHEAALKQATTRPKDDLPAPVLDLATLPPAALQRYLSRYGLLEPHGSLSYYHAVFPTPPLPNTVEPPLHGRQLQLRKPASVFPSSADQAAASDDPNGAPAQMATTAAEQAHVEHAVAQGEQPAAVTVSKGKKRAWHEPNAPEFARLSAYDDPQVVINRLAQRATAHFATREGIKEGEFLTNFMFALRMRSHTLRATPPG